MIANNIFRAIGDFFTNVLFTPFESIQTMDNWWIQNMVSWVFLSLTLVASIYWIGELEKHKKTDNN